MPQGLLTDFYQLTMAAGYFEAGKSKEKATFELFLRRLPHNRNFVLAAGLAQAVEYLQNFHFTREEIAYLRELPQFRHSHEAFFEMLAALRFTGDVFAVPEGTPMFADEPFLTIRAPIIEAQIIETYLLETIGFQSMIATKAARVVRAALGHQVVEFGTRRAHSPEAGVLAGRAAYIGGCAGTSNAETGMRYGVPVFGTAAHSWVMSFATELEAFEQLQKLLGENTAYLIDSYDTLEGARRAASLGRPLWGVRLDSGNLAELVPAVRSILDQAGLEDAKIMVTGDLNEYKIHELLAARLPIDSFRRRHGAIDVGGQAFAGCGLQDGGARRAGGQAIHHQAERRQGHDFRRQTNLSLSRSRCVGAIERVYRLRERWRRSGGSLAPGDDRRKAGRASAERRRSSFNHASAAVRFAACPLPQSFPIARLARGDERPTECAQYARAPRHARRYEHMSTVFIDVDSQIDFLYPGGALYMPGAEKIVSNIAALNRYAAARSIPVVSTMDAHTENDPEFRVWPPHCVAGTAGQQKPAAILLEKRVIVSNHAGLPDISGAQQVIVEKQSVDCFSNPNLDLVLHQLAAERCVVYGVATEICVKNMISGLLNLGCKIELVTDAIKEIDPEAAAKVLDAVSAAGGKLISVRALG